ncbi:MAG: hypothetical protein AB7O52_04200 [Planctomycetota bacterium]
MAAHRSTATSGTVAGAPPPSDFVTPGLSVWLVVALWGALMWVAGEFDLWRTLPRVGPASPLQLAILLPILAGAVVMAGVRSVRRAIERLDVTWLVGFQCFRVLGASHLVTWGLGLMAGGFAVPVGLGNLAVALAAVALLPGVARGLPGWERRVVLLTLCGLAEFAMTVLLAIFGFLGVATPLDPPPVLERYASIAQPPISLFPTFLIPLFSLVHVATLVRLRAAGRCGPA